MADGIELWLRKVGGTLLAGLLVTGHGLVKVRCRLPCCGPGPPPPETAPWPPRTLRRASLRQDTNHQGRKRRWMWVRCSAA